MKNIIDYNFPQDLKSMTDKELELLAAESVNSLSKKFQRPAAIWRPILVS